RITNYGEYLAMHPPSLEAEIIEETSWSCPHGIARWKNDCGCKSGENPWAQQWRRPLRRALDWLRDDLSAVYEKTGAGLFIDPWAARDDYINVVVDRSPQNKAAFFAKHAKRP